MTQTQTFEPDGRAIPIAEEGAGPAIVLLPGQGLNTSYLGALAHSVAQEDFRVVRIGSRRPTSEDVSVSLRDLAQDVIDVLDHLDIAHAWVGGHAFGGTVARTVSLDHHDRVNGVLLLGVEGPESTDAPTSADIPEHVRDPEVAELQRAAREAAGIEWDELAPHIPVLVIQGTEDEITPPANGAALQATAPDRVSVVAVEGGGHLFAATHVGATSWAIEDYLDWD